MSLVGWIAAPGLERLVVRYEDGATADVGFFRVSGPIDAAFFLFDVPTEHERHPRRAISLSALTGGGQPLAEVAIANRDPDQWTFPRYGGNPHHGFPPAADEARQRKLVFPGTGTRVWIAPAAGGVTCYIVHVGSSGSDFCPHDPESRRVATLDANHIGLWGSSVLLWGLVEPQVERVELRFQDGTRATTLPQERLVVYAIPERQYPPGKRLVAALLRDAGGRVVRTVAYDPAIRDRYPCDKPRSSVELGPEHCP